MTEVLDNKMGSIELYIGPMFSGKSSMLIKTAKNYESIGKKILAINNKKDTRYGINKITTHDKLSIDAIMVSKLNDIHKNYSQEFKKADIILIEELQFFNDIKFIINAAEKYSKKVVASGLDGDFQRKPFKSVIELIPYCDTVTKLRGFCKICKDGTPSIFSKRIVNSTDNILVGGSDSYISVCRKHFIS